MLLCDAAQSINGKLYIMGGGWSMIGPEPTASAIALKVDVPWDEANRKHRMQLALLNADEQPVVVPTPMGEQKVEVTAEFEVGRPPGVKPGTAIDLSMAFSIGPLPLPPDGRYVWRCSIDGQSHDDWQIYFGTRPPQKR